MARAGVALVAGGTGGIGAAVVRLLVERGEQVAFTFHRNEAAAERLALETGATFGQLDLTEAESVQGFVDAFEQVHTVVYAAGPHVPMLHLSAVTPPVLRQQLQDDTMGFFALAHACLPKLRASRGSLVAVTTAATARFAVRDGLSSIPKAAVEAAVRALAKEEGRYGVRVNCVGPGMLTDGMAERLIASGDLDDRALEAARVNTPLRTFGTARDVAEAVCFLASEAAGFISGQKLDVDGGYGC